MTQDIRKAATAVVVRDSDQGLEVLVLRRHPQLKVGGGHWVFPGGTIDPEDEIGMESEALIARVAASRETQEEASLSLDQSEFQLISHWTTPPGMGKRFATWFFLSEVGEVEVVVDGQEMDDHMWTLPKTLLRYHRMGEMAMMPPTVVTLTELASCDSVAEARAFYAAREVPFIEPQINKHLGVLCMLYKGDAGYASKDPSKVGSRNRCYLEDGVWRYEFFKS
ncbi:NUDIX domain-containing protein [Spongiibacter sp. KMU-158]|uniref:NUDIX domain-containing protein n=1 Tax=Spongiibacter pelagi TaxID=2760804 RepID=A0A927C1X6_9GAMM|nr:NUDIX domain-containing protein [Spongiibacter pelagi]MBD2859785.1 NUDIX domain-containing protein [Spongiibacter pelagi]